MPDDAPDLDEFDPADWPDALDAYRYAYNLAREAAGEAAIIRGGGADPARDLGEFKARVPLRGLSPMEALRIQIAIARGEADGRAGVERRW